jgi:hypothetical protein
LSREEMAEFIEVLRVCTLFLFYYWFML